MIAVIRALCIYNTLGGTTFVVVGMLNGSGRLLLIGNFLMLLNSYTFTRYWNVTPEKPGC